MRGSGAWRGSHERLFAVQAFSRLWMSNLLGDVGSAFATLALSVTAVVLLHASTVQVAVIAAMANGAYLFLGVPVGVWVDRVRPKHVLVASDLARFAAVATVPLAFAAHALTVVQLIGVAAVTSAANVTYDVAHTTILPVIVGRDRVSEASARLQTVDASVTVIGPALAGQLVARTAGPAAYVVTAIVHLASSLSAAAVRPDRVPTTTASHQPFRQSLRSGLTYVLADPVQRTFIIAAAVVNFGAGFIMAIQPLFILRTLHCTSAEYGLILSIGGVGGIVGSLVGLRVRTWLGEIRVPIVCYAVIPLAFAPTPLAPYLPVPAPVSVAVAEFLISVVTVVAAISSSGIYARMTPPHLLGRVTSARRTISVGVLPLGALVAGGLATVIGFDVTLWGGVAIMASSVVVFRASPIFGLRSLPREWEYAAEG